MKTKDTENKVRDTCEFCGESLSTKEGFAFFIGRFICYDCWAKAREQDREESGHDRR